ncbi:hypothetical protein BUE65_31045 [Klebsiella variicola]|uniref:hypothetical protein n=1 Tax=Klebsiella variicola TaxID=244366 RepID=UPI000B52DD44|nr:hypothetical protein [Klebsiella variicola]OWW12912.1 hypothetical protein BUE65_31045 [Klebsiella variicola]
MDKDFVTLDEFVKLLEEPQEQLSLVIKSYYEIDILLDRLLTACIDDVDSLEMRRISFILKVDILISLGVVRSDFKKLFNNINSIRNIYAHNPYSIFDAKLAEKSKTILMQIDESREMIKDMTEPTDILMFVFLSGYIYLEVALKNQFRKIQGRVVLNKRIHKALGTQAPRASDESLKSYYAEIESDLQNIYPKLFGK